MSDLLWKEIGYFDHCFFLMASVFKQFQSALLARVYERLFQFVDGTRPASREQFNHVAGHPNRNLYTYRLQQCKAQ
jgi:hypothetical protein